MLAGTALVLLLLLDEAAPFSLLPPPGAMLRPQLSCNTPTGRMRPGPGVRGVGMLLLRNDVYVAAGRSGWAVGVALGAGAISFAESKRQTDMIKSCRNVGQLAEIVSEYVERFSHVNVNTAWLSMARLPAGTQDKELSVALQNCTRKLLGKMEGRHLANLLHSAATLHVAGRARADDELVQQLASRSLEVLRTQPGSFDSQGVAITMWALGKLGARVDQELATAMQRQAIEIADDFNEQGVSNLLWGLATLGVEVDPQLVTVMQNRAIEIADEFNSQGVSNLLWALAKLGMGVYPALAKAMKRRAIEIANTFKPQEVSNLMWGLATLGVEVDPQLVT
ncbi:hypothetical protein T484DRAFT_1817026, partial [Baffinella frigidus]